MSSLPPAQVREASQTFRAAVQQLHVPRPVDMTLTGFTLIIPIAGEIRISDERIGDEPYCYWRLSGTPDRVWIWGPDLLKGDSQIPVYRLQGARS